MTSSWAALVKKPITPEQEKANLEDIARRKAEEAARALNQRASKLAADIETVIKTKEGGVSSNYPGDLQYTVPGEWTEAEAVLAFTKWKENLNAAAKGSDVALNMHKLGPTLKTTGNRNWNQFNFIRNRAVGTTNRFNVHADTK